MGITLKRYNSIRRADDTNDQHGSVAIQGALIASETQEELQTFVLSRLRQVIFGETSSEHWYDDFLSDGILSLKDLSASSGSVLLRVGVALVGPKDGANRVFRTTPDHFVHSPGSNGKTIEVWHNGRRLSQTSTPNPALGDYTVEESGGVGTGYDTINLLTFSPVSRSVLLANYQRV
jgi:hypothetical protein